ncbi:SOS response-associated peptidase [Lichenicola sp.]|uniref:SOS response-associated peptidase n=1 Tax=Lichenicola sp. TaxID=2804529 RepID=UPI003AFFA782
MCGRFASDLPIDLIRTLFGTTGPAPNAAPSWNIAPTNSVPVIRHHPASGERRLDLLRWGLIPHWSKDPASQTNRRPPPINARAETVATSGLFKQALAARRCIVPMVAFYEWALGEKPKQPYAFARADGQPLALAGLWESWTDPAGELIRTFVIITTAANATLAPVHDRMPVVLEVEDWGSWLHDGPPDLLRPAADDVLTRWKVSARVNSVRNDGPDLLHDVDQAGPQDQDQAGPDSA